MTDDIPKFEDTEEVIEEVPSFEDTEEISETELESSADSPEQSPAPEISQAGAASAKLAQGLGLGFSDEVAGGLDAFGRVLGIEGLGSGDIAQSISSTFGNSDKPSPIHLAEGGGTLDLQTLLQTYRDGRDKERLKLQAAEEQHPGTALAADLAGSLVAPIPGAGKIKALKDLGNVSKTATTAALSGGVESLGRSEADSIGELAGDTAGGALLSGALGGTLGKVLDRRSAESLAKRAANKADDANLAALDSLGATKADYLEEIRARASRRPGLDKAKGVGQTAIDEGIVKFKQSPAETNNAISQRLDQVYSEIIGPVAKQLDSKVDASIIQKADEGSLQLSSTLLNHVDELNDSVRLNPTASGSLVNGAKSTAENIVSDIVNAPGNNKVQTAIEAKRKIGNLLKSSDWSKSESAGSKDFLKKVYAEVSNYADNLANEIDPELANRLKEGNKAYSNLLSANDIATKELARDAASSGISLADYVIGGVGSSLLGPVGGRATVGAKKGIEKGTGKNFGKLFSTFKALRADRQAKELAERAANLGRVDRTLSENATTIATKAARSFNAATDSTDVDTSAPYARNRMTADYIKKSNPEELEAEANRIMETYGEQGEKLSNTLKALSSRDRQGRNALLFSIMQDPNNRMMLGVNEDEDQ